MLKFWCIFNSKFTLNNAIMGLYWSRMCQTLNFVENRIKMKLDSIPLNVSGDVLKAREINIKHRKSFKFSYHLNY